MEQKDNSNITIVVKQNPWNMSNQIPEPTPTPSKFKKLFKYTLIFLLLVIVIFGSFIAIRASNLADKIFVGQKFTFTQKIQNLIRGAGGNIKLTGEDLGQVNILLLGIGGENHDGPYLSDTIIVAQIRPDIKSISLTSIPRDYLIQLPNQGYRKINAAFAEGFYKNRDWDEAGRLTRQIVGGITGLDIPYFAVVDFAGFTEAVDKVGGIDVAIDRTFTDSTFPNETNGYLPPQTFTAGTEHMNGKRALIFARSRHSGNSGEGSDFARSQRQQKIIKSFKEKVIALNLITDASTLNQLAGVFANHFHTNIAPQEMIRLFKLIKDYDGSNMFSQALDPATGLICSEILPENGAYVLSPCYGKTKQDIVNFFKNSFTSGILTKEKPVIWIAAGNERESLYLEIQEELLKANITPFFVKMTDQPTHLQLFQVNPKPGTLTYFRNKWSTSEIILPPEDFKLDPKKVDVLVILPKSTILPKPAVPANSNANTNSSSNSNTNKPNLNTNTID